jgi:hypothetical protein
MSLSKWMAWEGGVDLVALTKPGLDMPNVIMHVARMVHTPIGAAPAGMILYQPDSAAPPAVMGFISPDPKVGAYFGPNIFAGTPFETAPVLTASIEINTGRPGVVVSRIKVADFLFEVELTGLGPLELINRAPAAMPPFHQQGLEAKAGKAMFKVNGREVSLIIPPVGISGGPAAVCSPCGIYAR